jgi:hypothetical protein
MPDNPLDFTEPEEESLPRRRRPKSGGPSAAVWLLAVIALLLALGVGGSIAYIFLSRSAPPPVVAGKPRIPPAVKPAPVKAEPPVKPPVPLHPNKEWEEKSRRRLAEGLALLDQGKTEEAAAAISYALADKPASPTHEQKLLLLEVAYRLGVIGIVQRDKERSFNSLKLAEYFRKACGLDADAYELWKEPLFLDTCRRMGVKK